MGKQNWPYLENESENQKSRNIFFELGNELRVRVKSSLEMLPTTLNITLHYLNSLKFST